jgi:hypothetical protein
MANYLEEQGAALMDGPIPGESLTADPENPNPWETAPEYSDVETFIDDLFLNSTSKENIDGVLDPIRKGIPVEDVAQLLLFQAMASGKITTDLVLTAVEPTIYMLIGIATFAEVRDIVLYPEDDMDIDEEDEIAALEASANGEDVDLESLPIPDGISNSLVAKLKDGSI